MRALMGSPPYDWDIGCGADLPKINSEIDTADWGKIRSEVALVYSGAVALEDRGVYGSREPSPGYIVFATYYGYRWGPATGTRAVLQIGKYGCSYCKCPQYRTTTTIDLAAHIVEKHAIRLLDNCNIYRRLIFDFGTENVGVAVQLEGEPVPDTPYGFPYRIPDIGHIEIPGTEGIMAEIHFFTSVKPPEETVWCPKMKDDIPISEYPGDKVCKYEACGKYAFDTQEAADTYRQTNCPGTKPTVECTIDAECPEGYECKNGICVKKTAFGKMSMWQIGMGAGAILGVLVLFGQKLRKKEKK